MKSFDDFLSSVNDDNYENLAKLVASKYDMELTPHDDRLIRISVSMRSAIILATSGTDSIASPVMILSVSVITFR